MYFEIATSIYLLFIVKDFLWVEGVHEIFSLGFYYIPEIFLAFDNMLRQLYTFMHTKCDLEQVKFNCCR